MSNPTTHSIVTGFQKTTSGAPFQAQLDDDLNLKVNVVAGGAGGGAVTVADGADVAQGTTTDVAITSDASGTIIGFLRGLVKMIANVWDSGTSTLKISAPSAITVQQPTAANLKVDLSGTAANTTAIKVDGSAVTQPVSIASTVTVSGAVVTL